MHLQYVPVEFWIIGSIIWLISAIGLWIVKSEKYEKLARTSAFYDVIVPGVLWIIFALTIFPAIVLVICLLCVFVSMGGSGGSNNHGHGH